MITRIGLVAGDIWSYLDKNGGAAEMEDVIKAVDKDRNIALMSVGWLAREGHVVLEETKGSSYTVRLKKEREPSK